MKPKHSRPAKKHPIETLAPDAPLGELAARLACALPQTAPPPRVREQLLARIRAEKTAIPPAVGFRFAALDADENWVPLPFPGVRMREVTVDDRCDTALVYVEMTAGAVFPDHEHAATERGLVLSGDFRMGGKLLRAGDFYEAEAGTRHERLSSPSGCTGLLWLGAQAWRGWRAAMAEAAKR